MGTNRAAAERRGPRRGRFGTRGAWLVSVAVVAVSCTSVQGGSTGATTSTATRISRPADDTRPNVVVIMTDDQRWDEMKYLPKTTRLIGTEGTTFNNSFVSFPLCCPSRATHLSGQYAHNHRVLDNTLQFGGGNDTFDHSNTLPVWLRRAGYATGHVGKYLNEYGETSAPVVEPGYDDWFTAIDPSTYHFWDYDVLDNGTKKHFGSNPEDYQTTVFTQRAVQDIDRFSASGKPFYLTVWPLAPHAAEGKGVAIPKLAPAPDTKYAGTRPDAKPPKPASFMEADLSDKPKAITALTDRIAEGQAQNNITDDQVLALLDTLEQARAESLASVDDMVEQVVQALERNGQLANTLIVFTSDNGWMLGEHRVTLGKVVAYEESIRVPLLVRGPGFPKGTSANQPVVNVDIPATVLAATGVAPGIEQDGITLAGLGSDPNLRKERALLVESGASGVEKYHGIRTPGFVFIAYDDGGEELYDLFDDPYQLANRAADPDPRWVKARSRLKREADALRGCKGQACVTSIPSGELR